MQRKSLDVEGIKAPHKCRSFTPYGPFRHEHLMQVSSLPFSPPLRTYSILPNWVSISRRKRDHPGERFKEEEKGKAAQLPRFRSIGFEATRALEAI